MAFSTKLNLDNSKIEQTSGSTLTLNGSNVISSTGSLNYSEQPIFNSDTQIVSKKYVDDQLGSGTTASTVYNLSSPSAVEVGGVTVGTVLTGKTSNELLEEILVPTLFPSLSGPSATLTGTQNTQEVGVTINTTYTAGLNRGSITPAYGTSGFRSGLPNSYDFNGVNITPATTATTVTGGVEGVVSGAVLSLGANTWSVDVNYDQGEQPLDSVGGNYLSPLPAGTVSASRTITGIYPYFYGFVTTGTRPTATSDLVSGGTKVVSTVSANLVIDWNSGSGDYIWFALPATSATKTAWEDQTNSANSGLIGGAVTPGGSLFPAFDTVSVTTVLWAGVNYEVYISNYQVEQTNPLILKD